MKAAIYHGVGDIRIEEVPRPKPATGYVVVEMMRCGICGSDLHSYKGLWEQPSTAHGHEVSGVVAEYGTGVWGVRVGDRVCMEWFSHCGTCQFCRVGAYNLCDSLARTSGTSHAGFADFVVAHQSSVFQIPDAVSFEEAALIEPLSVAYRAVRRSRLDPGGTVHIVGSGTIGLLAAGAARATGAGRIVCRARYDHQAAKARDLGADLVLREQDAGNVGEADAVIETTARPEGVAEALSAVRKGGTIVLVGGFVQSMEIDLKAVVDHELKVIGSFCYGYSGTRRDFESSIELIASGKVAVASLVTHRFPLTEIERAFTTALDKRSQSIKVALCAAGK